MTREAIEAFEKPLKTPANVFSQAAQHTKHVLQLEHLTRNLRRGGPVPLLDFGCGYGEKPACHVTSDPMTVAKTEIKRLVGGEFRVSTQQYFRKL
jgi:hypothetical protein